MATSTTANFELTRDQIIRRAFQLAGMLEASQRPRDDDLAMANDFLGMELDALQAEGVQLRTVQLTTQALVSGTAAYTLAADVIDVFVGPDNIAGMIVTTGGAETSVRAVSRQEYLQLTNKDLSARATLVYIAKLATTTLTFWPVPNDSTETFRYSMVRLPRDADTGTVTLDVARRWQKAICYSMAWQIALAKSAKLERVNAIRSIAEAEKRKALANDVENVNGQFYVERYS